MNRLEFSQIASESFGVEATLVDLFNELLAFYNLINFDSVKDLNAERTEDELLFNVSFEDKSEVTKASGLLHADCMRLHEYCYCLSNEKTGSTSISIRMKKL